VHIDGGTELTVALVDCYAPALQTNYGHITYEEAFNAIDSYRSLAITIPEPIVSDRWFTTLVPNATLAGWLWLGKEATLNRYLVDQGFATPLEKKSMTDRSTS
jgi:hypothetical protein